MKVGDILRETTRVERVNLVMYAGASGDFNPIHWNDHVATAVGLPDVIAHGMYTQAQLGRLLGDPANIVDFSVRFSAPVVVPATGYAELELSATVEAIEDGIATVSLAATCGGHDVVKDAVARVRV
jgi:acyl dehydratase